MLYLTNAKIILHLKYRYFLHLKPKKRYFFNLEVLLSDLSFIPQSTEILILLTTLHKSTFKCQIPLLFSQFLLKLLPWLLCCHTHLGLCIL